MLLDLKSTPTAFVVFNSEAEKAAAVDAAPQKRFLCDVVAVKSTLT